MKLIQVSDLHFVPPGTRLFGLDPRARLEAAIADINRHHGDAELCLFTGDLADRGAPEAYEALRETLAALQVPYRLTLGNHDDRGNFLRAFPEAPRDEHGFVQTVVSTGAESPASLRILAKRAIAPLLEHLEGAPGQGLNGIRLTLAGMPAIS